MGASWVQDDGRSEFGPVDPEDPFFSFFAVLRILMTQNANHARESIKGPPSTRISRVRFITI